MSYKLSKTKIVRINNSEIYVASKGSSFSEISKQFERFEKTEVEQIQPVSFSDRMPNGKTIAECVENTDFTTEDLPFCL